MEVWTHQWKKVRAESGDKSTRYKQACLAHSFKSRMRPYGPAAMASLLESGTPCCSHAAVQARPRPAWRSTFTDCRLRRSARQYAIPCLLRCRPMQAKHFTDTLHLCDTACCICRSQNAFLRITQTKRQENLQLVAAAATEVGITTTA